MFIREKKFKNRSKSYLQIVENEWENGHVKQKVILSLGCLQSLKSSGELRKMANSLLKFCESEHFSIEDAQEERRYHWGIPNVIEQLWNLFNFSTILAECSKNRSREFDLERAVKLMLQDRFISPCSKLKSYEKQGKYENLDEVPMHHLYRSLDYLCEFKEQIEQKLFEKNRTLFNMRVDVVFYDVTTFYFESETSDSLRDCGFSKDNKFGEVQVVMGLLVDMDGRPIGYDIFPGNTYEGHTLKMAIGKLEKKFAIQKLILVADRGMMSGENLNIIRNSGYEYIISCRLKKLHKDLQKEVLDLESYQDMPVVPNTQDQGEPEMKKYKIMLPENIFADVLLPLQNEANPQDIYRAIRKITKRVHDPLLKKKLRAFRHNPFTSDNRQQLVKEIEHYLAQRWILTWSSKRAHRDKAKRDLLIEKAQELLAGPAQSLSQRGPRRYLKLHAEEISLDQARIEKEQEWDGFYGICTNNPDLHWQTILEHYRNLWHIEESFRILKSHFQTRPMFHWTVKRVKGHLVLCFIAFLFERTLELQLKKLKIDYSPDKIREALNSMQLSLLDVRGQKFHLCANINSLSKEILKILHIKMPPKIAPVEKIEHSE
jgi:transposase